jgi:NifU-like protein involved in Fe-S cluster formation
MIRDGGTVPDGWPDLAAFEPVRDAKSRHECVLLPFEALEQAVKEAVKEAGAKAG